MIIDQIGFYPFRIAVKLIIPSELWSDKEVGLHEEEEEEEEEEEDELSLSWIVFSYNLNKYLLFMYFYE